MKKFKEISKQYKEEVEQLEEKNAPTNPELWSRAKALARSKFDVYPSAYANGWASKWYKSKGGGWKTVSEAVKDKYDEGEYDQEGDMAKSDLRSIIANAKELHNMIDDADNLPEWCQNKITLAEDYISTVANYMAAEMSEEVKDEYARKVDKYLKKKYNKEATSAAVRFQRALEREREKRERNERAGAALLKPKQPEAPMKKEAVDMVSVAKLMSRGYKVDERPTAQRKADSIAKTTAQMKPNNPAKIKPASVEDMHKQIAKSYASHKSGQYVGDSVEVTGKKINEARPSQRHPLEGHEYHKKSDEALIHIAKDAHKAAEAMKGHNTDAENKYRDQANDSATVRHFRKTSGMPDWYKKKYGHMKESFKPMDEPKYNLSIQARQKKADDNKLPFDGPYKKSTGVVTDKSGAKHGPMSIARHLARMAAKKQANVKESTEPLQESRKAEIVREAMKIAKEKKKANSEDKFIADPELNSKVIKTAAQM